MGRGGTKVWRVDIADTYDPRITGRAAQKGTLFRYIPSVGDPELLIKADDGFSTNWISFGTAIPITVAQAGSVANVNLAVAPANLDGVVGVVGDLWLIKDQAAPAQNGVYTFNGAGVPLTRTVGWDTAESFVPGRQVFVDAGTVNDDTLWANADYVAVLDVNPVQFIKVSSSVVVGDPNTLAYFDAAGLITDNTDATFDETTNSMAFGNTFAGTGTFTSTGNGSVVRGYADAGAVISATAEGSSAFGRATGAGALITATQVGSLAQGSALSAGTMTSGAAGAHAHGVVSLGGQILADGIGAEAAGLADSGQINSNGFGAKAFGSATTSATIIATSDGSESFGASDGVGSTIQASSSGAKAHGRAFTAGQIVSSSEGASAHGRASGAGVITASGNASSAFGYADGAASAITASGDGAFAGGNVQAAGVITSSDFGSFAFGANNGGTIQSIGPGSVSIGVAAAGSLLNANATAGFVFGYSAGAGSRLVVTGDGGYAGGYARSGGSISATNLGSKAHGYVVSGGTVTSSGRSSHAFGSVDAASITSSGPGSFAYGLSNGAGSSITASGDGAQAHGSADTAGTITASGIGSHARGYAPGSTILASGIGASAFGVGDVSASANGALAHGNGTLIASADGSYAAGLGVEQIRASAFGAHAFGYAENFGSGILSSGNGSLAFGHSQIGGSITASGDGSLAHGYKLGGSINATGAGSHAFGYCHDNGGIITASGDGCLAAGVGTGNPANQITASGNASFAMGEVGYGNMVLANNGGFSHGIANEQNHSTQNWSQAFGSSNIVTGTYASAFGQGHTHASYACIMFGRYGLLAETIGAWVATEAAIALGNGTGIGTENIGWRIDKDGRENTFAAQKHAAVREGDTVINVSARTDRSIFVDTSIAATTVNLPPGEDGLEYFIKDSGNNAVLNNITIVPNGADTVETAAIIASNGGIHIQFFKGSWRTMTSYVV